MRPGLRAALSLEYPMSLGVYDSYDDAQRAVDYLSDHEFPVQDVLIVGTDLKQLERVTGRLTRGRAIGGGALSGAWLGLFIGTIFALFDPSGFNLVSVLATVAFGAVFGVDLDGGRSTGSPAADSATSPRSARSSPRSTRCSASTSTPSAAASCSPRWTRCAPPSRRSAGSARPSRPGSRSSTATSRRQPPSA